MRRLAFLLCSLVCFSAGPLEEVRAAEIHLLCQSQSKPSSVRKVFVDTTARYVKYGRERYRNGKKSYSSPDSTRASTEFVNINEDTISFGSNYSLGGNTQTTTYTIDRKTGIVTEQGPAGSLSRVRCSPAPTRR